MDLSLLKTYLGENPYRISRKFLQKKGERQIYAYGETPLMTFAKIAKESNLNHTDVLYELGCGRGRVCFFAALILKMQVVGIDFVPEFIEKAKQITKKYELNNPQFYLEDFLQTNLSGCTAIYLNGTCMDDKEIIQLIQHFNFLSKGVKAITISFSFEDYPDSKSWKTIKTFPVKMSWGETFAYLQIKDC